MEMLFTSIKLNLLTQIGTLSAKKIELLDNLLLGSHRDKQKIMDATIYINPEEKSSVIIGPNQIGYGIENPEGVSADLASKACEWNTLSLTIADTLLMDQECNGYEIDFTSVVPAPGSNRKAAAAQSIRSISPIHHQKLKDIGDITAVGVRYVFNRENHIFDCRVEPLLSNLDNFFLSMNIKVTTGPTIHYSYSQVFESVNSNFNFFKNEWFDLVKNEIII